MAVKKRWKVELPSFQFSRLCFPPTSSESKEPRFRLLEIEENAVLYIQNLASAAGNPGWSRTSSSAAAKPGGFVAIIFKCELKCWKRCITTENASRDYIFLILTPRILRLRTKNLLKITLHVNCHFYLFLILSSLGLKWDRTPVTK